LEIKAVYDDDGVVDIDDVIDDAVERYSFDADRMMMKKLVENDSRRGGAESGCDDRIQI
jgi:hypothetical protein